MSEQNKDNSFDKKVAESLLSQVSLLIKKNDELLAATGARFNMFKACGVNHYENTHSKILAELLNPKGSHDMGSVFLEAFLRIALSQEIINTSKSGDGQKEFFDKEKIPLKIDASNGKVGTEISFNYKDEKVSGRMDILITNIEIQDSVVETVCIENKIYAKDQWEQLKRYDTCLTKDYSKGEKEKHRIIYLTLNGYDASEQSADGVAYIPISYREHVVKWIEECIPLVAEKPMIRETLCQYRNHIKNLTGTDLEKQYMDELVKLVCKNKENYEIAEKINNSFFQIKQNLVCSKFETYFDFIKKTINERFSTDVEINKSCDFSVKDSWVSFASKSWKFEIVFQFDSAYFQNLFFGIYTTNKQISEAPWDKPQGYESSIVWPLWKAIDLKDLIDLTDTEIKNYYQNLIEEIYPVVNKILEP